MQNKEELIAAVDRAVEALEMVRRYLVENTEGSSGFRSDTVNEEFRKNADWETSGTENKEIPVYSSAKEMGTAAKIAIQHCREWLYRGVAALPVDVNLLLLTSQEEDQRTDPASRGAGSYYLVSPEGAIGFTKNDSKDVEWLFLPVGMDAAALPASLKTDLPQAASESAAEPDLLSEPDMDMEAEFEPRPESAPEFEAATEFAPEFETEAEIVLGSSEEVPASESEEAAEPVPEIEAEAADAEAEAEAEAEAASDFAPVPVIDFEAIQEQDAELPAEDTEQEQEQNPESEQTPDSEQTPESEPEQMSEPEPEAAPKSEEDPASASSPRFCRACGAQLKKNAHFCSRCGRKVG